ncbi:MAG: ABC transporter permease subunit [Dinoroseobacter sp.]|nr:ABC transporter permease subunit [Dinoroseobacter sp.]
MIRASSATVHFPGTRMVMGAVCVLAAWQGLAAATTGALLVAGPLEVINHIAENAGLYARAVGVTLSSAAWGFLLGNLAAVVLAALAILRPRAQGVISGLALLTFCLPLVATGPILRVVFGPGEGPQITLAALAVYYTTYISVLVGLRAVPATWLDLVTSYGRGRGTALWRVQAYAALPYLVSGLQIAAPAAILGALVGEFTGAERGLGVLTLQAMRDLDVTATWAIASLAAVLSIMLHAGIGWIANRVLNEEPPLILAPPVARGKPNYSRSGAATGALTALIALSLWWGIAEISQLSSFFFKRPDDVWVFLVSSDTAAQNRAELTASGLETARALLPGYFAGLGAGAGLAILLTLVPGLSSVAMPIAIALRAAPIVTTAPLLVLVVGRGAVGSAVLVAVMVFFPVLIACLHGLSRAPGQVLDVMDSYAAGRWRTLIYARLPAMLPAFFGAARMTVPAAVLAVTVVEWLATGRGLGALMALSASLSNYGMLWSVTLVVAVSAVAGYAAVARLERAVLSVFASEQVQ